LLLLTSLQFPLHDGTKGLDHLDYGLCFGLLRIGPVTPDVGRGLTTLK